MGSYVRRKSTERISIRIGVRGSMWRHMRENDRGSNKIDMRGHERTRPMRAGGCKRRRSVRGCERRRPVRGCQEW